MQLLIVTQYFWPENFRINDLVAELVRRGHMVTVLTGLPNYPDGKVFRQFSKAPDQYAHFEGAEIVRVPLLPRGQTRLSLVLNYATFAISASIVGLWKLRKHKFDAIFTYEPSPITVGLPAILMRSIKHAPLVFWVLDLWPETLSAVGAIRSPRFLKWMGKLVAFIYRRCDLILAQSKSFIPQIQKYAGYKSRIAYFPSWAEPIFFLQDLPAAEEVPAKPGCFNLMFAGNIGDAQDFPAILMAAEILKSHPHIRWLIVGDGRMADWVADEIKRRELQDTVLMLGRHSLDRMPSFFKHANALLVSLKDEPIFSMTIPGKLQSYLSSGIPVLAMLNGEGAEVVNRSGSGLTCAASDHVGLAKAVLALSKMTAEERQAMGRNGKAISVREFDRTALIAQLEEWMVSLKKGSGHHAV